MMKEVVTNPSDALRILWEAKFFFTQKDVAEVRKRLATLGYNFNEAALLMALMRAKFLTRRGKKGNYSYIQIHPYVQDNRMSKKK